MKYLNNIVEADHGKLKRLIKPTLGFKSMKTAYATLKGFEVMRMFRKGQFNAWFQGAEGITGEIRLNRKYGGTFESYNACSVAGSPFILFLFWAWFAGELTVVVHGPPLLAGAIYESLFAGLANGHRT
jgi:DDE domain